MKDNRTIRVRVVSKVLAPKLKTESETKFCHACGGWCFVHMRPCEVCHGTGSVVVFLPALASLVE